MSTSKLDLGACQEDIAEATVLIQALVNLDQEAWDRAPGWLLEHEPMFPGPETT